MKVSIITVTYNNDSNLKKTLDALLRQDYDEIESIIIDGGSTDHSVEIIKKFEKRFRGTVKWVSEKDNGLYNALNKGLGMVTGDIIGCYWDEYATDDTISKIVKKIQTENCDGAHGDLIIVDGDKTVRYWKMGEGKIKNGWMPAHPTLYLKKEVYEKYGIYKENYKCSADYEFMVRSLKDGSVKLAYIPEILIRMFYGGVSTNGFSAYKQSINESVRALKENGFKHPYYVILKRVMKTIGQFRYHKKCKYSMRE